MSLYIYIYIYAVLELDKISRRYAVRTRVEHVMRPSSCRWVNVESQGLFEQALPQSEATTSSVKWETCSAFIHASQTQSCMCAEAGFGGWFRACT